MKERSIVRARKTSAIRAALFETSGDGPLEIRFHMLVTKDTERTFYQGCTKYRAQLDLLLAEKNKLVKSPYPLRKQINHLQSNIV